MSFFYGIDNFRIEFFYVYYFSEVYVRVLLMEVISGFLVNRVITELMVRIVSKVIFGRVENLFRSCYVIVKIGRFFKDFIWMCKLDDMKGVDIGLVFRINKLVRIFIYFIVEVERKNLRDKLVKSKFFFIISDGIINNLVKEVEFVYV